MIISSPSGATISTLGGRILHAERAEEIFDYNKVSSDNGTLSGLGKAFCKPLLGPNRAHFEIPFRRQKV